jgi:hypothetical protein
MSGVVLIPFLIQAVGSPAANASKADQAFAQAVAARETGRVAPWLHDDFSWIDTAGTRRDRAGLLSDLHRAGGLGVEARVQVLAYDDAAVAFGDMRVASDSERFARIWVRTPSGGWRLLAYQVTRVASPSPVFRERGPTSVHSGRNATNFIVASSASTAREREIVDAFRAVQRAEHSADAAAYAALTADEFHVVGVLGQVGTKAGRFEAIRTQTASTPFPVVTDVRVRVFGDAAVMTATQEPVRGRPLRFTRLWIRRDGRWQQVVNQQTAVAQLRDR